MKERNWPGQATDHFEIQAEDIPTTHRRRILVSMPLVEMLPEIHKRLLAAGVPKTAALHFHQWNSPLSNYYITAEWKD